MYFQAPANHAEDCRSEEVGCHGPIPAKGSKFIVNAISTYNMYCEHCKLAPSDRFSDIEAHPVHQPHRSLDAILHRWPHTPHFFQWEIASIASACT
jgi:hypothetical protein